MARPSNTERLGAPNAGVSAKPQDGGDQSLADPIDGANGSHHHDLTALRGCAMRMVGELTAARENAERKLLGKEGAIDGLNTLTQIVIRVIDKERQCSGLSDPQTTTAPDEHGIERRIAAELDRIAARNGTPPSAGADRPAT